MNDRLALALWILFLIYIGSKILSTKKKKIIKYDKLDEVLHSDKYKVKGQYD